MLSTSAFNALLKTLEEPPAHVVFILATTEPQRLPATILSRCQRFDFGRIPAAQIAGRLREVTAGAGGTATDGALNMIARAAEGGMRDAISTLDMCLGYQNHVDEELVHRVLGTSDKSFLFRFAECLQNEDAASLMGMIDDLMRSGREPVVFAKEVSQHLRALLMARCCREELTGLLDVTEEDAAEYMGQSDGFTEGRLMKMMELFMAVETELRFASSPRLALETAALKACMRTTETDVNSLNDRIQELEKQVADLTEKLKNGVTVAAPVQSRAAKAKPVDVPKAAPAPVPLTPTGRSAPDAWKEAMNQLKKSDPSSYSMLTQGTFVGCEGNLFRWEAPIGMDFFVMALNKDAKRNAIADALSKAVGIESRFDAVVAGSKQTAAQIQSEDAYLEEIMSTFGAENVSVQEGKE